MCLEEQGGAPCGWQVRVGNIIQGLGHRLVGWLSWQLVHACCTLASCWLDRTAPVCLLHPCMHICCFHAPIDGIRSFVSTSRSHTVAAWQLSSAGCCCSHQLSCLTLCALWATWCRRYLSKRHASVHASLQPAFLQWHNWSKASAHHRCYQQRAVLQAWRELLQLQAKLCAKV